MTLQQAYYEQKFENAFLRAKGDAFQDFFETLMGFAYKADFMACRPWGNRGDRKNDGFLKSERRLFQVYAPNEMTEAKAVSKIKEDFEGGQGVKLDKRIFSPTLLPCHANHAFISPAPFIMSFFAAIAARTSSSMRVTARGFSYCSRKASSVSGIASMPSVS
jgi:hypothetical protein